MKKLILSFFLSAYFLHESCDYVYVLYKISKSVFWTPFEFYRILRTPCIKDSNLPDASSIKYVLPSVQSAWIFLMLFLSALVGLYQSPYPSFFLHNLHNIPYQKTQNNEMNFIILSAGETFLLYNSYTLV